MERICELQHSAEKGVHAYLVILVIEIDIGTKHRLVAYERPLIFSIF